MNRRIRTALPSLLGCAAACGIAAPTFAQTTTAPPDEGTVAEIVVTAQATKSGVPLKETPQSVTIIDRAQLDQLNVQTIEETFRYVPSIQSETGGSRGFDNVLIRGFNQSAYEYRDGLRLDPGYLEQQEPYGLERLEVLKGPASVLYGQISPGGLVNFVSKQPRADLPGEIMLEGGSYGQFAAGADVGGKLDKDGSLLWRLTGVYRRTDDPQPYVGSERVYIAPALGWRPAPATKITLLAVYQDDHLVRTVGLPVAGTIAPNPNGPIPIRNYLGEPSIPRFNDPQYQIAAIIEQGLAPGWTLRTKARYTHYDLAGGLSAPIGLEPDNRTVDRFGITFDIGTEVISTDTQIEGVFTTGRLKHRLLVGFDYLHNASSTRYHNLDIGTIDAYRPIYTGAPPTGPEYRSTSTLEQVHPYAQYRLTLDDHYVVTGGIGYGATFNRGHDLNADTRSRQDDHKLIGDAALLWIAPGGFTAYVSYAQSFEPQVGVDPLLGGAQPPPTEGTQWEAGVKWEGWSGRAAATLAVFDIDLKNVVNDIFAVPVSYSVLTGGQRNRGVEIEGWIKPVDALTVRGGYTYLDARITDSTNGDVGLRPSLVPQNAASGFATLDGKAFGLVGADIGVGVRYQGPRRGDGREDKLAGFVLVDLAAHYRLGAYTFGIDVKNLFDRRYWAGADFAGVIPGQPLIVQASLRRRF